MAIFSYRAIDEGSRIIKGRIEAPDENELEERLNLKGLTLIDVSKIIFSFSSRPKLTTKDLLNFTYFLNLILSSGVSIMSGLSDMARQSINRRLSLTASLLHSKLESGRSISESMSEYPKLFPSFYTSMVRAGEASGNLEQVLNEIMAHLEWQIKLKKDIRSALAYPVIVLAAVVSLITILFVFVMPKFMKILADLKVDLPLPTKILVYTVEFVKGYWPFIVFLLVLIPLGIRVAYNSETGRRIIDIIILKMPVTGELVKKLNHSRYFRTFATLYRSGLSMNETLRVSAAVVKNTAIADAFSKVTNSVLGGEQLNRALKDAGGFGPLLINMVEIGEKTGTLDNTIMRISDMYDREVPETLKRIFTIIEPVMIVLLGGLVLLTLASFFLSLYKIVGGIHR